MADINEPEPGQAVISTTDVTPHPADESSAPGPYTDLPINRPPVSTNRPDVPIAQSLTSGAGAGNQNVGEPEVVQAAARAEPAPTAKEK